MGIFKDKMDQKESLMKTQALNALPGQFTAKQEQTMTQLNTELHAESQEDGILMAQGLETLSLKDMETRYNRRYETIARQRDQRASDRTIRDRAEAKTKAAMNLHKKIKELCDTGKSFKDVISSNYHINLLNSYSKSKNKKLTKDEQKKLNSIKKNAPKVYERLLKLEHVTNRLSTRQNELPDLYACAVMDYEQAKREWDHIVNMSEQLISPAVKTTRQREEKIISDFRKAQKSDDAITYLDQDYQDDLEENLKKKTLDFDSLDVEELKKRVDEGDTDAPMLLVLKTQMNKILEKYPDTNAEEVQKVVSEYLVRLIDKSAFHIRAHYANAIAIMNTRLYSSSKIDAYERLKEKMYSKNTDLTSHQALCFGSLGSNDSKEFVGKGLANDPIFLYGNISFRLNKEKMKGRVTFVAGNSKGMVNGSKTDYGVKDSMDFYDVKHGRAAYVDKKKGHEPDITACGENLFAIYERARQLKQNNWDGLESADQEALKTITDKPGYYYYEAHYHGQVGVAQMDEITMVCNMTDFSNEHSFDSIRKDDQVKTLYEYVATVNKNPQVFGREGMKELKFSIWDIHGNTISYLDLKNIFENNLTYKEVHKK